MYWIDHASDEVLSLTSGFYFATYSLSHQSVHLALMKAMDIRLETSKLGEAIRRLRKQKGFSQESFADACSLHRTYIGSIERGERNVSIENIIKIASTLKILPSDLLREAGM
jgi:ribosome-binding protein aMBF1 (putative translation factor)